MISKEMAKQWRAEPSPQNSANQPCVERGFSLENIPVTNLTNMSLSLNDDR